MADTSSLSTRWRELAGLRPLSGEHTCLLRATLSALRHDGEHVTSPGLIKQNDLFSIKS